MASWNATICRQNFLEQDEACLEFEKIVKVHLGAVNDGTILHLAQRKKQT
jgi:hypothetical protein